MSPVFFVVVLFGAIVVLLLVLFHQFLVGFGFVQNRFGFDRFDSDWVDRNDDEGDCKDEGEGKDQDQDKDRFGAFLQQTFFHPHVLE